jgi:rare lipoprotein A
LQGMWYDCRYRQINPLPQGLVTGALGTATLLVALAGCGAPSIVEQKDSGPKHDVDISHIPDATPHAEPRSRYGNPPAYVVLGKRYHVLDSGQGYRERGIASWYGTKFHGRRTSSGERYDMYRMTAAHKTLPLPTYARVTNLRNGRSVVVKVNDRGPFHQNRIIDLSYAAAKKLGIAGTGTGLVEVQAIDTGKSGAPPMMVADAPAQQQGEPDLYLQVGAFSSKSNAQRMQQRLNGMQLDRIRVTPGKSRNQSVYRVRIGPIDSVEQADQLARLLVEQGMEHPHVVIE